MNVLYKGARLIKDMYNQLNPATLTGAIDILVIEHEDGVLTSSPFHVRFGKLGVLRAKEKLVNITINDEEVGLHMKLGDQGEAFFVVETNDEELPLRLLTSPLPSRPSSPFPEEGGENNNKYPLSREDVAVKRKRRKRRKRRSLTSPVSEISNEHTESDSEEENMNQQVQNLQNINSDPSDEMKNALCENPSVVVDVNSDNDTLVSCNHLCNVFSDSEFPLSNTVEDGLVVDSPTLPFSDSELINRDNIPSPVGWDWGQLPGDDEPSLKTILPVPKISKLFIENEKINQPTVPSKAKEPLLEEQDATSIQIEPVNASPSKNDSSASVQTKSTKEDSPTKSGKASNRPVQGLYLDEILDLEPTMADLYFSSNNKEDRANDTMDRTEDNEMDNARTRTPEASFVTSDAGVDSGTDCLISDDSGDVTSDVNISSIAMSLCGGKYEDGKFDVDKEKFDEKLITYEQFLQDPVGITNNTELVILFGDLYCDWATAGPLLLSLTVYKKRLSQETMERVINMQLGKKTRAAAGGRLSWLWRRSSHRDSTGSNYSEQGSSNISKEVNDTSVNPKLPLMKSYSASPTVTPAKSNPNQAEDSSSCDEDEVASFSFHQNELKRAHTMQHLYPNSQVNFMKKTTRLTSEQLKSLNLKPGANEVVFSVTSQYQGTSRCFATVYLWKWNDKLVVSDIDGTITKSDVFGQILPVVGKDWTQGGVAQLYHNISKNGYKFIYLSSRAIGQAGMTKGYLNWINQQGVSLPAGPLFLSPTSLMRAFRVEVIEKKPEKFKIECLKDITSLFSEDACPLVAGFGNKINDVLAYKAVGVPKNRIFTINHHGELKQEDLQTYTTSYSELGDIVDTFFPALDSHQCKQFSDTKQYSAFNYWKSDVADITDLDLF